MGYGNDFDGAGLWEGYGTIVKTARGGYEIRVNSARRAHTAYMPSKSMSSRTFQPRNLWRLKRLMNTEGGTGLRVGQQYELKFKRYSLHTSRVEQFGPYKFTGYNGGTIERVDGQPMQGEAPKQPSNFRAPEPEPVRVMTAAEIEAQRVTNNVLMGVVNALIAQDKLVQNVFKGISRADTAKLMQDEEAWNRIKSLIEGLVDACAAAEKAAANLSLERLLVRMSARDKHGHLNVMLVGPAGCGKSTIVKMAAEKLGLPFYADSFTLSTPARVLVGYREPDGENFVYVSSQFVECYENGGVYLADEFDAADANVLCVLHMALANGYMIVEPRMTNRIATRHHDAYVVAACNTYGSGSRVYVAREELDEATLSRFVPLSVDYDLGYELNVANASEHGAEILAFRDKIRAAIAKGKDGKGLRRVFSTRHIEQWIAMRDVDVTLEDMAAEYFQAWSIQDRETARTLGVPHAMKAVL
jgi:MoxR-like ATPase